MTSALDQIYIVVIFIILICSAYLNDKRLVNKISLKTIEKPNILAVGLFPHVF